MLTSYALPWIQGKIVMKSKFLFAELEELVQ